MYIYVHIYVYTYLPGIPFFRELWVFQEHICCNLVYSTNNDRFNFSEYINVLRLPTIQKMAIYTCNIAES